ncbi:hypothetical protein ACFQGE_06655 [Halomicroarcula sp. GCM10025817]|uniref:hypothetical protein n=1 Tax=Haloarcula TaxID=2237 RepID=UPI0023E800BC|nr:hypothetical protein [Halomicroarcula sp. SYNS111]
MDRSALERELEATFDAGGDAVTVVARQARDLADSGRFDADFDAELTVEDVVENLEDAPEGYSLAERWNWWLGALEVSHGGYTEFGVRQDRERHS